MDVVKQVRNEMLGRIAEDKMNVYHLLEIVKLAGDGNYLEIGVLHGGCLCAVALHKKQLGQKGRCYGIDPLDGYYMDYIDVKKRGCTVDPVTRVPVSLETVKENINRFDLTRRVIIEQAKSHPYPLNDKLTFAVTYIDGDHWGGAPLQDWMNVKDRTEKFVIFDNHDQNHPAVMEACQVARADPEWAEFLNVGITFALRRRADTWQK